MTDKYENLRRPFLEILAENEDDLTTRLIYADWLDDAGLCEEAERMRLWPGAKKWMVDFSERCRAKIHSEWRAWANTEEEFEEWVNLGEDGPMTYHELIDLGQATYDQAPRDADGEITDLSMWCGNRESMMYLLMRDRKDFWRNWSIITGNPLPTDLEDLVSFRCSC